MDLPRPQADPVPVGNNIVGKATYKKKMIGGRVYIGNSDVIFLGALHGESYFLETGAFEVRQNNIVKWISYLFSVFLCLTMFTFLFISKICHSWTSACGIHFCSLDNHIRPWTLSLNIWLKMLPSNSFMSCLDSLLGYYTGELQPWQLIVLVVFGVID